MIDSDLARLYGIPTKALNQAVRRNSDRFPDGFMFRLTTSEWKEVVTNCDHLRDLRFSRSAPMAFTDYGVAMLSSVLKSPRATRVNIEIIRTFVHLRKTVTERSVLSRRLDLLEQTVNGHDVRIKSIFQAIRQMIESPASRKRIGFRTLRN